MAWVDILEEHASEAAFLAELRALAFVSYRQTLRSLAELEERLAAHLDGLLVSPGQAWELAGPWLGSDAPGEAFVATWLALEGGDPGWTDALEGALAEPASREGLGAALRLSAGPATLPVLQRFAASAEPAVRALALDALAFRGQPVAPARTRELFVAAGDLSVLAALGIAGRLRQRELSAEVAKACEHPRDRVAVLALQTLAMLDDSAARAAARTAALRPDRAGGAAMRLLGAIGAAADAVPLQRAAAGPHAREALLALGRLGEAGAVDTLLSAMDDPARARAAGHGFEIFTGASLQADGLALPPGTRPDPREGEEEETLALDPDEGLAWPAPARVRSWWESRAGRPKRGERWRLGAAFDWEAVAAEAASPELLLPDRDDVLMELTSRLSLEHVERRDWSARSRPAPSARDARRAARDRGIGPWPAS